MFKHQSIQIRRNSGIGAFAWLVHFLAVCLQFRQKSKLQSGYLSTSNYAGTPITAAVRTRLFG